MTRFLQTGTDDEADERKKWYAGHECAAGYDGGDGRLSRHVKCAFWRVTIPT